MGHVDSFSRSPKAKVLAFKTLTSSKTSNKDQPESLTVSEVDKGAADLASLRLQLSAMTAARDLEAARRQASDAECRLAARERDDALERLAQCRHEIAVMVEASGVERERLIEELGEAHTKMQTIGAELDAVKDELKGAREEVDGLRAEVKRLNEESAKKGAVGSESGMEKVLVARVDVQDYDSEDRSDDEVPRKFGNDGHFSYTPHKPKYAGGIEFVTPENRTSNKRAGKGIVAEYSKVQPTVKSPDNYQDLPIKKAPVKTVIANASEELDKLRAENKKLHEHLRKLLNGRPSNLSINTVPNNPSKSFSPLRANPKKLPIDLEAVSRLILEINPSLNIISINDSTIEVNKKRLSLVQHENKIVVKVKDQLLNLKDYIKSHFSKEAIRAGLSGSKLLGM